ncbi:hypothetical protein RXV86_01225 [Alisedimentitalea sp. MJ-SS2]|uniref:hypothetical protein n=1 Tax=Aliisedimentitalea sp. MJ-SS2 TaxID=3049795 RepID=UPI0029144532|nr:hypothetical protein [Alisedimentitalea sp. MJ-SS2]MDU8925996.1 hypothetical protein [Alisedimentitalea sp. MJ-SS2]
MTLKTVLLVLTATTLVAGCSETAIQNYHGEVGPDKSHDLGRDKKHLSQLRAGIWVDPNGCDHWIIDDGVEGYLSARLDKNGKPVCSGTSTPNVVIGPFKGGDTRRHGDPL